MAHDAPFLANPRKLALGVFAAVMKPPPPIDFNAWAVENVVFGPESPFPGPYDPERFPHFARPLACLSPEEPCTVVVVKGSAQWGKTTVAQIFAAASLDLDPGPFLYVHPTEPNAVRWSKQKWKPFAKQSLPGLLKTGTSRDGGSSILYQERKDGRGFLQMSGANSEASLSMVSAPRQVQDDLAKWEMNNAGDPEVQADSRSKAFWNAKKLKIGTPLIEPGCRITRAYQAGTQEQYHVPCPHCGHAHPLAWETMLACLDEAAPEDAHFTCPNCNGRIEEHHRPAMLRGGRWVADNPNGRYPSFHVWAAYSPMETWRAIAEAWIDAKGDPAREQAFLNDWIGKAYRAAGEAPPWEAIRDRAEAEGHRRGTVPPGGLLVAVGVDVQGDWLAWHVMAFGRDLRRWTVDYGVIEHYVGSDKGRAALDELLKRSWPDAWGNRRGVEMLAIDGNAYTEDVWDWAKRHPMSKVIMVRGAKSENAPALARVQHERGKDGKVKRYAKRFFNVGVSGLKMALYQSLKVVDPLVRAFVGFPKGLDDAFYQELCAERRAPVRNRLTGFITYRWVKDPNQRNEVLDTVIQAEAAAIRLGWRRNTEEQWARLEAERERPPSGVQLDLEEMAVAPRASESPAKPAAEPASGNMIVRSRFRS